MLPGNDREDRIKRMILNFSHSQNNHNFHELSHSFLSWLYSILGRKKIIFVEELNRTLGSRMQVVPVDQAHLLALISTNPIIANDVLIKVLNTKNGTG